MFEVKVTFEAGESIKALVSGLVNPAVVTNQVADAPKKPAPKEDKSAAPRATAKPQAPAAPKGEPSFEELDDAAKLEAIKAEVTKQTKNKKGADIKFMLAQFDAGRASELAPERYDEFYAAILRYGKGEAVTDIFPADDDLN